MSLRHDTFLDGIDNSTRTLVSDRSDSHCPEPPPTRAAASSGPSSWRVDRASDSAADPRDLRGRPPKAVRHPDGIAIAPSADARLDRAPDPLRPHGCGQRRGSGGPARAALSGHDATVLLQSTDNGTAAGVLLPAHWIRQRAPDATVAVFPSDHFIMEADPFMDRLSRRRPTSTITRGGSSCSGRRRRSRSRSTAGSSPGQCSAGSARLRSTRCAVSSRNRRRTRPVHASRPAPSGTRSCSWPR
jgi:hypothetical protein